MSSNLKLVIDPALQPTASDNVAPNQLMIDVGPTRYMMPGSDTMVKLTVRNYSTMGCMCKITAIYDGNRVGIEIPTSTVYVAPQGETAVYAIVRTYAYVGVLDIVFKLS